MEKKTIRSGAPFALAGAAVLLAAVAALAVGLVIFLPKIILLLS